MGFSTGAQIKTVREGAFFQGRRRARRATAPGPSSSSDQPRRAAERSIDAAVRNGWAAPLRVKVAVTAWFAFMVNTQVERPVQSPLQPLKRDLEPGDAVSVTVVPPA